MTFCLAPLTVQIAQIHNREAEGSALEMGANTEHSYIIVQKKKGFFFLVCFVFPSHILLPTEKMLLESWMEKTSAPFIPVGA